MSHGLSDNKEEVLLKSLTEWKGTFSLMDAAQYYSSKSQAKSAVKSLVSDGYLERLGPGRFKVTMVPPEIKKEAKEKLDSY